MEFFLIAFLFWVMGWTGDPSTDASETGKLPYALCEHEDGSTNEGLCVWNDGTGNIVINADYGKYFVVIPKQLKAGRTMGVSLRKNIEHVPSKPMLGTTVTITQHGESFEGTVLDYDESGEFALVWWHESGTRDYRYIHQGYSEELAETMEW